MEEEEKIVYDEKLLSFRQATGSLIVSQKEKLLPLWNHFGNEIIFLNKAVEDLAI